MSVMIDCDKKFILRIRNSRFGSLYERMLSIIEEENLLLSNGLNALIEALYVGQHGIGCDIADYIKAKDDIEMFAYLVKRGIETDGWVLPYAEETLERLWYFHAEIVEYGKKVKVT